MTIGATECAPSSRTPLRLSSNCDGPRQAPRYDVYPLAPSGGFETAAVELPFARSVGATFFGCVLNASDVFTALPLDVEAQGASW